MSTQLDVAARAHASRGASADVLYRRAASLLASAGARGAVVDVGCGAGALRPAIASLVSSYVGVDVVRFPSFPSDAEFRQANLDIDPIPAAAASADIVTAIEVIEHVENPRRFMRELARIARPGAVVLVSTPNQRSGLSTLSLVLRGHFAAFSDCDYPAHISALLAVDLLRISAECGLVDPRLDYSLQGRVPLTGRHYPRLLSRLFPRALSDNVFLVARSPRNV